ncbi:hypothetical protein N2W22_002999 [Clostridium perfringens]|nr:hypothetical protein [Clostridium perfringens]EJT6657909.1 hypothetical protein [Clostridium perfringens]
MKNKVDKEFGQIYWNLSYRGKVMRTLWTTPLVISVIIYLINSNNHIIITVLLVVIYLWQLIYTYSNRKKKKNIKIL